MGAVITTRKQFLVVVAIDFGTVNSGFAYSFKGNEENIKSADHGGVLQQDRVPTVLLLNPDKTFHSFGYKAQTNFYELSDSARSKYYYFEDFKMKIYDKSKIERKMVINDISGKKLEAMKVFSIAIKHLKDKAIKVIHLTKIGLKDTDIQWMITIPAISSDSARQFMREATTRAGIPETNLRLVLEPEAAALYSKPRIMLEEMPCGYKYVLADLGGGTSDICVHKLISGGKLQEMYRTIGEASGGSDVDRCFISMMETLTGKEVWSEFSSIHSSAYVSLINEFRSKKKEFKSDKDILKLKMENALLHVIYEKMMKSLNDLIKQSKYAEYLEYHSTEARLIIDGKILEELFLPSVDRIVSKLKKVLDNCADSEIKTIILVGGYSESQYLRERIQSKFSDIRVVLLEDARMAVLNGAVAMGWKPKNIIQRRSRYSYGFSLAYPFREGIDPEDLLHIMDGVRYCTRVFKKIIEKGQIVEYGQAFKHEGLGTARTRTEKHTKRRIELYRSTLVDPKYCIEKDECRMVGGIILLPPPQGWPVYWEGVIHLVVGETEFTMKYFNSITGEEYKAQLDFL